MKQKKLLLPFILFIICIVCISTTFAHQGKTDANGGHRDNNNSSGLGSYHYHCGGYPAHLHSNGYCPYTNNSTSVNDYEDSYDYGYEKGYEDGYEEGHSNGYDEGYDDAYDKGFDKGHEEGYKYRIEEAAAARKKEFNFLLIVILVIIVIVLLVKFIKRHRKKE